MIFIRHVSFTPIWVISIALYELIDPALYIYSSEIITEKQENKKI